MKFKNLLLSFISILAIAFYGKAQVVTCNANFTESINGLTVLFTPGTIGDSLSTNHIWNFGDGGLSQNAVPLHTYSSGGVYTVKHIIQKKNPNGVIICVDSVLKMITLSNPCNIQAFFNHTPDSLNPLQIQFFNNSPGFNAATDTIRWSFGDGTPFVYTQNPSHTYTSPGVYNVCIRISRPASATNTACVREYCKQILVSTCYVDANFNFTTTGLTAAFLNASVTNGTITSYIWNFGNGNSSTVANPVHTYNSTGSYYAILQVFAIKNGVTCNDSIGKWVTVTNPCNLQANFSFVRDSINRKKFYFSNTTLNFLPTDSIRWNFGDGSPFVYTQNPTHTYTSAGTYNVCIKVTRPTIAAGGLPCISEICKTVVVDSVPATCNAAFTHSAQGLTVSFLPSVAIASNTVQHQWFFGNGNTSNLPNPVHTYSIAGTYIVKHIIIILGNNGGIICSDTVTKTIQLTNSTPCNLQANFSFVRDTVNRKKYYFTNTTVNFLPTDSIRWNFGDGSPFVYTQNPTHTFANYGVYTVCIRISRPVPAGGAPCVKEVCKTIIVDSIPQVNCNANFTFSIQGLTVGFVSAMQNSGVLHQWSFGNGSSSTLVNPIHTYANGGVYNVKHIVKVVGTNGAILCTDSVTKTITLITNPCNLQANFTNQRDSINKKKYYFTNTSLNFLPTDSIRWNFGDGSPFVFTQNPTHTFANYGLYNVCLKVWRQNASGVPCVKDICKLVAVDSNGIVPYPCPYVVDFNMTRDSSNIRKVYFTNLSSTLPGAIATWNFGDGTTATGWNVVHTYPTAGAYYPCLKITYTNTCIKTRCKVLQVPSTTTCTLQPYPNPASTVVNAQVHLTQPQVIYTRIYNMQNIIVVQQQQNGNVGVNTVTANVATLPIGMYKIRIQYGNRMCSGTFMKN